MDFLGVGSSVLGGLLGGAFRLFPEVLKFFDAKNERAHELAMQDKQLEFLKVQGSQKVEEARINQEAVDIGALRDVLVEQAKPTGNKFIDACNSFVRPYFAYSFSLLYFAVKIVFGAALFASGHSSYEVDKALYTPDDQALFWGVVNFFFLDRVMKYQKK